MCACVCTVSRMARHVHECECGIMCYDYDNTLVIALYKNRKNEFSLCSLHAHTSTLMNMTPTPNHIVRFDAHHTHELTIRLFVESNRSLCFFCCCFVSPAICVRHHTQPSRAYIFRCICVCHLIVFPSLMSLRRLLM